MKIKGNWILIKLVVVLTIIFLLLWLITVGGCLDYSRVKLYSGNERVGSVIILLLCSYLVGFMFLLQYAFKSEADAPVKNLWRLANTPLLI